MNIERHHRRIRRKTRILRWALPPLALGAVGYWLYAASAACQEAESAAEMTSCRVLHVVPFLPSLLGAAVLAMIVWDLAGIGVEIHAEREGARPRRRAHHAAHGWRAIDHHHRRHIHWAALSLAAVTLAVGGWIGWQYWTSTR